MEKFDFNKIEDFDKHINLSIPNYDWLHAQVQKISQYFIQEHTNVYDLGCSTGKLLKGFDIVPNVKYYGVDKSDLIPPNTVDDIQFIKDDVRNVKIENASFITSLFVLQFLSRKDREFMVTKIKKGLNSYGAVIVCEKTYSSNAITQDVINSMYYEFKEEGFDSSEILKKERELRHSLNLLTIDDIMEELSTIGDVDIFWRCFNFVGCLVVKR